MAPEDEKLAREEARQDHQHEAVKSKVASEVQTEIARSAEQAHPTDQAQAKALASDFKQKAVSEVAARESEIGRAKLVASISQVADYLFYLIYGIIGLEFALDLLGARQSNAFKQFLDVVSAPVLAPFRGLMSDPSVGRFRLMISYVVAVLVYVLLHAAVNGFLRLFAHRKTEV
ncbi:MAG TPA: hypothetical protein VKV95_23510 [Terriglobia bacterium]|nr:hypothetical protein [Terriglobia bacterium]